MIARAEPTLTEITMALPQRVSFKAETFDEEGIRCSCTVEEISKDSAIISFDTYCAYDTREIRNRTVFKLKELPLVKRPSTNNFAIE